MQSVETFHCGIEFIGILRMVGTGAKVLGDLI